MAKNTISKKTNNLYNSQSFFYIRDPKIFLKTQQKN